MTPEQREKSRVASLRWRRANTEKARASERKWRAAHPGYKRDWWKKHPEKHRNYRYKCKTAPPPIPDLCQCCGMPPRANGMHLDHCHITGQFRGWICGPCNQGIGLLGDGVPGLLAAVAYLQRTNFDLA